ncbi:MAG TPA: gas vesicle protein [Acidimicrobiales bacterium]|nr:gas vesicle protein [Acidimicrobiales bacterium]
MIGDSAYRPAARAGATQPANLADLLERILDKGLVIAGDISISLVDVELLTIKLRLLIASADKAAEMGIDWWRHDPHLNGSSRRLEEENRDLRQRLADLERELGSASTTGDGGIGRQGAPHGATATTRDGGGAHVR